MNFNQEPKKVKYTILYSTVAKYDITLKNTINNVMLLQLIEEQQQLLEQLIESMESE